MAPQVTEFAASMPALERHLRQQIAALVPRLRRFAVGLTGGSVADADDLVQAGCERALTRLNQWRPDSRLDSWMFRIVQTIWFNELAARKRRAAQDAEIVERQPAEDGVRRVEARLTLAEVQHAFTRLPDEQRAVLLLVCAEGYTYREAAEILGIPIGTVMSRLSRGRLSLFDALKGASEDPSDNVIVLG